MVATIAGALLLGLLLVDVFGTVFNPRGRGGPINRYQNRVVWRIMRRLGTRSDGSTRDPLLSYAAPLLIILTLLGWFLVLTAAFALVYLPHIDDFIFSDGASRGRWIEALYFSGYTAATLGLGDVVPDAPVFRILTPLEAFAGFALVSVSVTYLLATYRELIAMRTTAADIHVYLGANDPDGGGFSDTRHYEAMARWAEAITHQLLHILQSHFQYPILHYFRPADPAGALPVRLRDLRLFLDARRGRQGDEAAIVDRHPSFRALGRAMDEFTLNVERHFVPGGAHEGETKDPRGANDRILEYMLYSTAAARGGASGGRRDPEEG